MNHIIWGSQGIQQLTSSSSPLLSWICPQSYGHTQGLVAFIFYNLYQCQCLKHHHENWPFSISHTPPFSPCFQHQFPGLSQSANSTLGDSSSDSGGDIPCTKATDMCHRPLVFLSSAPPSLPSATTISAPYPQPLSPQGRLHHHHHHHPLHSMHGSHHHHHQAQMNQVPHTCISIHTGDH